MSRLKDDIVRHEGLERYPYKDTLGYWTVGIGHKLSLFDLEELLPSIQFTEEQIQKMFYDDVAEAELDAQAVIAEGWEKLNESQREVVIEMAFQLGRAGISKFKRFISAIKAGDMAEAGRQIMDSLAAKQTPARYTELLEKWNETAV